MSLSLRLDVRQAQGLVMTPQLQQAIKLLQLSNLELTGYVEQELEQNPFLERAEAPDEPDPGAEREGAEDAPDPGPGREAALDGTPAIAGDVPAGDGWAGAADDGWSDPGRAEPPNGLGIDSLGHLGGGGGTGFDAGEGDLGEWLSEPPTLRDHLLEQLRADVPPGRERLVGAHLIELVDDDGYLRADLDEVAGRLGCPRALVNAVLARLQGFDPPGIFARSLPECLALQLRDRDRLDPAMRALLDHLDLLARFDYATLVKVCGVQPDDLPEMIAEIKALNPKPGLTFAHESVQTVVPDVFVWQLADGSWQVELNAATLPRVLVNNTYYAQLYRRAGDRREKEYVSERFQSANWLVKALDQRARTVLKVAEALVERQLAFLDEGVQQLRPMVLRDIAAATGLHESTVSRATAGKYLATPRGIYPFKYFFSNALPGTDSEANHSAEAIRQQIRALIDREHPERVLSDDQIVELLRKDGVVIARRTVAKYRESLAIPSSVQRRRAKSLRLA